MNIKHIIVYFCITIVVCFPSKPLNERRSELSWQAWLLVDAQNPNPNENERRITPKSVFIAPNIGDNGSSLPECAEGYRSDPMGRCIKFVKVDEAAHLDFLLQRLNAMYATRPTEELDDEERPTSGPLQLNIPLGAFGGSLEEKDPEIAIIVAPTNGNFEGDDSKEVVLDKRMQNKDEEKSTTISPTEETTISTTIPTTTTSEATTESTTTSDDLQALFFLLPMNKTNHVQNHRTDASLYENTPTEVNSTPLDITDTIKSKPNIETFLPTLEDSSTIRLPALENYKDSSTVRFPSESQFNFPPPPEAHRLTSGEIEHLFQEYISKKPDLVALTSTDVINRRRPISGEEIVTYPQLPRPQAYLNPVYNHRNRDRSDFWRPATQWREETQKPLVLRFSRHPFSQEQNSEEQEEYTEAYGRKRRRGNIR